MPPPITTSSISHIHEGDGTKKKRAKEELFQSRSEQIELYTISTPKDEILPIKYDKYSS